MYRQTQLWSTLYFITIAWAVLTFWISPHLPLTDLPQHAGQIALLKDMLLGQSKWSNLFQINLLTPYLTTYALATILSFVVSVSTAFKILLSIGYIAFVYTCIQLRKHFQVDSRLDWLFVLPFFGFAYKWGFISFVLSAPIGLWFILLADRYLQNPTNYRAIGLSIVGILLLESHGLMFLFSVGVSSITLILNVRHLKSKLVAFAPYIFLGLAFLYIFEANLKVNEQLGISQYTLKQNHSDLIQGSLWQTISGLPKDIALRSAQGLFYTLVQCNESIIPIIHIPAVVILFLSPFLFGLRINTTNKTSGIVFIGITFIFMAIPNYVFGTWYVYQRFAILVLPAYAFLFSKNQIKNKQTEQSIGGKYVLVALMITCWAVLSLNTVSALRFKAETAGIDRIINTLKPREMAIALIFDEVSVADNYSKAYRSYVSWYETEKNGLVFPNFAIFAPMLLRSTPNNLSKMPFAFSPNEFDWVRFGGDQYRYFFVRTTKNSDLPANFFKGAPCEPKLLGKTNGWIIFERANCSN